MLGPLATLPDRYILDFTNQGERKIDHWFRMECLLNDLIVFVGRYIELPRKTVKRLRLLETKKSEPYNHNVHSFFSPDEIEQLYCNNPLWRDVEMKWYGGLFDRQ